MRSNCSARSTHSPRGVQALRVSVVGVVLVLLTGALAGCSQPTKYVALGDSYVAGPLILPQVGPPYGCLKSGRDYPSVAQQQLHKNVFVDVSCSGATTDDMFAPQNVNPGPANPPQLTAVDSSATLVSLGIGGNDIGFSSIVKTCGSATPWNPCRDTFVQNGNDELSNRIAATKPKVVRVLQAITQRAPQAKVLVVGYPTILPATGNGCYPLEPITPTDVPYLRAKVQELNAMLASAASENGATYVDTATSSVGHDICQLPGTRWVEGLIPTTDAAPVHPNATGMAHTAGLVAAAG